MICKAEEDRRNGKSNCTTHQMQLMAGTIARSEVVAARRNRSFQCRSRRSHERCDKVA